MNGNTFEMTGRVNYIKLDYSNSGNAYCRLLISKKAGKDTDKYNTFPLVFFGDVAQKVGEEIDKGDTINVAGYLISEDKDSQIIVTLRGLTYQAVEYDEQAREYVPKKQTKGTKKSVKQGELPWV